VPVPHCGIEGPRGDGALSEVVDRSAATTSLASSFSADKLNPSPSSANELAPARALALWLALWLRAGTGPLGRAVPPAGPLTPGGADLFAEREPKTRIVPTETSLSSPRSCLCNNSGVEVN